MQAGAVLAGVLSAAHVEAAVIYTARSSMLQTSHGVCDAQGCGQRIDNSSSSTDFAPYDVSIDSGFASGIATASQQSSMDASGITVSMLSTAEGQAIAAAASRFSVDFVLDEAMLLHLVGYNYNYWDGGHTTVRLTGPDGFQLQSQYTYTNGTIDDYRIDTADPPTGWPPTAYPTVLQPGAYTFFVDAVAEGPFRHFISGATAQLSLAPVPIPAAWLLLASGLMGVSFLRRR